MTTGSPAVTLTQVTPLLYTIDFVLPNVPTDTPNTWSDTQTFTVEAIFNGGFIANDEAFFEDDATFHANATMNNVTVAGTFSANGTSTFQNASVFGDLSVGNDLAVSGGFSVGLTSDLVGGIIGKTDGSAAAAGIVGEVITASVATGAAVSLVTGTAKTVMTLPLTAGEWVIYGVMIFKANAATTIGYLGAGPSLTDNTLWADGNGAIIPGGGVVTDVDLAVAIPAAHVNNATNIGYFFVAKAAFGVNTLAAYGKIFAVRIR